MGFSEGWWSAKTVRHAGEPTVPPGATKVKGRQWWRGARRTGEAKLFGFEASHGALSAHPTVVRYDRWGTGLSDRARTDFPSRPTSKCSHDLINDLRLRRFALIYGTRASALILGETWAAMRSLILAGAHLELRDGEAHVHSVGEAEVLELVAGGHTNAEVAAASA